MALTARCNDRADVQAIVSSVLFSGVWFGLCNIKVTVDTYLPALRNCLSNFLEILFVLSIINHTFCYDII